MFGDHDAPFESICLEYMEKHAKASRLALSSSPDVDSMKVGHQWVEDLQQTYSVILLDEIEKLIRMYLTFCCKS